MSRKTITSAAIFILMAGLVATTVLADLNHLVPVPVTLTARTDTFTVPRQVLIYSDGVNSDSTVCWVKKVFDQLHVSNPTNFDTAVHTSLRSIAHVRIIFLANPLNLGTEGYTLLVTRDSIVISAPTTAGQFYAVQTLRQMLPPEIENAKNITAPQKLPGCSIVDYPRFAMRGTHFDIARHFYSMTYLRQLVDRLAAFKCNTLHLHLTDDQGWRIQITPPASATGSTITAYNNLTAIGGQSQVGGACVNCFFTQAQLRDSLVKYAIERKINIIPEIDMPGHIQSAIAAFAQAGITISSNCWSPCNAMYTGTGVGQSNLQINPVPAIVDTFIKTVWTQAAAIFPSPYLHMGGDETPVTGTTYGNFVKKMETVFSGLGRKLLGWEDIYGYTALTTSINQTWNAGNDHTGSIFTWCSKMYYDQSEAAAGAGYNNWCTGGNTTLQVTYGASANIANHIGVLGAMWTEMTTPANGYADRDMWPRHAATSELGWSAAASLNFTSFQTRMQPFGCRFSCMGLNNYFKSPLVTWATCAADTSPVPTNALSNYNWKLIPVDPITGIFVNRPNAQALIGFKAQPNTALCKVIDVRGRKVGVVSGKALASFKPASARGMYYVVDENGVFLQKVLVK